MLLLLGLPAWAAPGIPHVDDAHIAVDGRADEAAWAAATVLPDATVYAPSSDVVPLGTMVTRVLCDDDALYVSFVVTDPEPEKVRAGLGRRDTRYADDRVGLYLDPNGDGRRAYLLQATAIGVQLDGVHLAGEDLYDVDLSWDGVWRSAGVRTATGYVVEIAVPWSTIHLSGSAEKLALVATREVARAGQSYAWPRVEPNTDPLLAEAPMPGPPKLPRRLGLEVQPELTGAWSEPTAPSARLEYAGLGPGLTLHYEPSAHFGAAATVNPDFSQLESDATQIDANRRYALFYDEKRPFFLQDQDWFGHPMHGVVYTRSMNAPLYGVRAAGEVGAVGLAALNVLDRSPPPSVNEGGGWTADQLDGHDALATLARARLTLPGGSSLGLLGSDRTILGTDLDNQVLGIDGTWRIDKRFRVSAAALGSSTTFAEGEAPVLAPAGVLSGLYSSETLYVLAYGSAITPDFRQENGFVTQSDLLGGGGEAHYNLNLPGALSVLSLEPLDGWAYWDFAEAPRERAWDPSVWAQFADGSFLKVDARVAGESFAGTWVDYANSEVYGSTSAGSWLRMEAEGTFGTRPYYDFAAPRAGLVQSGYLGVELQPVPAFVLSLDPGLEHMTELSGEELYLAWTGRVKAELFLDRHAWVRAVGQASGSAADLDAWRLEPVAAWEWTPGSALYAGGTVGATRMPDSGELSPFWQVFAKVSWRFQV